MAITHLNDEHFTLAEKNQIAKGWNMVLEILSSKARNLSPEDRQKYGSIKEENKLVVQKVLDYNQNQPHLSCPEVNYAELQADWDDRMFLAGFIGRMVEGTHIANSIRITHDYDAINSAKADYNFCKYKMDTTDDASGFETKYKDLLYFFRTNTSPGGNSIPEDSGNESK